MEKTARWLSVTGSEMNVFSVIRGLNILSTFGKTQFHNAPRMSMRGNSPDEIGIGDAIEIEGIPSAKPVSLFYCENESSGSRIGSTLAVTS